MPRRFVLRPGPNERAVERAMLSVAKQIKEIMKREDVSYHHLAGVLGINFNETLTLLNWTPGRAPTLSQLAQVIDQAFPGYRLMVGEDWEVEPKKGKQR